MSQTIEIEFKTLLSNLDYQKLVDFYGFAEAEFFTQTNVYYDTPNFDLKTLGAGLRIRLFDNQAELTLKTPLPDQGTGLLETTDYLNLTDGLQLVEQQQILPDGHVAKLLHQLGINVADLVVHAELKTKRVERQLTPDVLLVLDESWYHQQHDYELEMEVQQAILGKNYFNQFLEKHNLTFLSAKNKIRRAIEAKLSI